MTVIFTSPDRRTTITGVWTFRGRGLTVEQGRQWASNVEQALGSGYGVQFEVFPESPSRNHLHVTKRKG